MGLSYRGKCFCSNARSVLDYGTSVPSFSPIAVLQLLILISLEQMRLPNPGPYGQVLWSSGFVLRIQEETQALLVVT